MERVTASPDIHTKKERKEKQRERGEEEKLDWRHRTRIEYGSISPFFQEGLNGAAVRCIFFFLAARESTEVRPTKYLPSIELGSRILLIFFF